MIESWWYLGAWELLVAVWLPGALCTKSTARSEPVVRRLGHTALMIAAAWLLFSPVRREPTTLLVFFVGAALTWLGIAIAIWARFTLGSNWSGSVVVKRDHRLVIAGPYCAARHPIYSGILLAMLGTALGSGELRCLIAVPVAFVGLWIKSRHEEGFMREQFGEDYVRYQARVKAIVPGVF